LFLLSDADHEGPVEESKIGDETVESLKLVEVVDELKLEIEEQKEGEVKPSGDKEDVNVEEGDVKKEDGELSVDVHRESKLCYHVVLFCIFWFAYYSCVYSQYVNAHK